MHQNHPTSPITCRVFLLLAFILTGCTTLENRRDLYFPQSVWGPYTKMLHHGIPAPKSVQGTWKETASDGKSVVLPKQQ